MSRRPTGGAANHFPCFDGLRAIAAVTVVFHHVGFQTGTNFEGGVGPYLARMDSGVSIFFLISGFLLYHPFARAHQEGRAPLPAGRFYRRRFLRIFPAYWLALTGMIIAFGLAVDGVAGGAVHYSLLKIYDPNRFFAAISQAWSLATEISYYLLLPFYAWAVRRLGRGRPVAEWVGVGVLFFGSLAFRTMLFPTDAPDVSNGEAASWTFLMRYWLPAYLDLFAIGMALALLSLRRPAGVTAHALFPWASWALAGAAFWVVANHAGLDAGLDDASPTGEWVKHALYGLTALFLLLPAIFGPQDRGLIRRFLASPPMVGLGVVSYGIYLWHQGWLGQVREWLDAPIFEGDLVPVGSLTLLLTVLTATASYLLVEKPILRFKDPRVRTLRTDDPDRLPATAVAP